MVGLDPDVALRLRSHNYGLWHDGWIALGWFPPLSARPRNMLVNNFELGGVAVVGRGLGSRISSCTTLGSEMPWIFQYALIYLHRIYELLLQYGIRNVRDEFCTRVKMLASS